MACPDKQYRPYRSHGLMSRERSSARRRALALIPRFASCVHPPALPSGGYGRRRYIRAAWYCAAGSQLLVNREGKPSPSYPVVVRAPRDDRSSPILVSHTNSRPEMTFQSRVVATRVERSP